MANYAQTERQALADLLEEVGPDAPTLCDGWRTADLAAHLVMRERRPDAAAGIAVRPLAGYTERVLRQIRDTRPWPDLVEAIRKGPPLPLRVAAIDAQFNTTEYFVHHEDVRRAPPDGEPRTLPVGEEQALWSRLKLMRRMLFRSSPVGVMLDAPGHGAAVAKQGDQTVTISGPPSELTLFAFGREAVANVELHGNDEGIALLRSAKRRV